MATVSAMPDQSVVILSSGQTLKISGVMLYPSDEIAQIVRMKSEAAAKLGGISTGIGFFGSPEWALGAGAALGLLEMVASNVAQKAGLARLAEAQRAASDILARGLIFRCSAIEGIAQPNPAAWSAQIEQKSREREPVDLSRMSMRERSIYLTSERKPLDIRPNFYSHNGDDFVALETEFGIANIRWSGVIGYIAPQREV